MRLAIAGIPHFFCFSGLQSKAARRVASFGDRLRWPTGLRTPGLTATNVPAEDRGMQDGRAAAKAGNRRPTITIGYKVVHFGRKHSSLNAELQIPQNYATCR